MRRVIPLVLALVAAIPQAAFAGQWYRCRYTGETRSTCCCSDRAQPPAGTVSRADCCDLLRTPPTTIDARAERGGELVVQPAAVAVIPPRVDLAALEPVRAPIARATAPPERSTPLYLLVSSLIL